MTTTDIQVSSPDSTRQTASQPVRSLLRSWVASYVALYEPKSGSTVIDVSPLLRSIPMR